MAISKVGKRPRPVRERTPPELPPPELSELPPPELSELPPPELPPPELPPPELPPPELPPPTSAAGGVVSLLPPRGVELDVDEVEELELEELELELDELELDELELELEELEPPVPMVIGPETAFGALRSF